MKKIQFLFVCLLFLLGNKILPQGIHFIEIHNDSGLVAIEKRSKQENKLIFIDCYTDWCGPCKWMEKNIFTNDTVAMFYNEKFVCVRMNMEQGAGILRECNYKITAYPTLLFLNSEGIQHRVVGARNAKEMMEIGEIALNPEKRFSHWEKQYKGGNRKPEFIREYLKQLNAVGLETKEIADWYFFSQNKNDLLTKENFEMIELFVSSPNDSTFDFLLSNKEKFSIFVGKERVEEKIFRVFQKAEIYRSEPDSIDPSKYYQKLDEQEYNKLISKINRVDFQRKEEIICIFQNNYYHDKKDWKNYAHSVQKYMDNYTKSDWREYNFIAWEFYENKEITDKILMEQALEWTKKSMQLNNNYYNNDTYAALLYKLGRKKEALKAAEKAITMGKKIGENVSMTEELIEKMKK